jgi:hypothetical protein
LKRWPIIRHVRYIWWTFWFYRWFNHFQRQTGRYWGIFPAQSDLDYLQAIWDGKV